MILKSLKPEPIRFFKREMDRQLKATVITVRNGSHGIPQLGLNTDLMVISLALMFTPRDCHRFACDSPTVAEKFTYISDGVQCHQQQFWMLKMLIAPRLKAVQ